MYANLANYALALQRFDEARQAIHDAQARKTVDLVLRNALYALVLAGNGWDTSASKALRCCVSCRTRGVPVLLVTGYCSKRYLARIPLCEYASTGIRATTFGHANARSPRAAHNCLLLANCISL
jgi:hypothetical protein